MPTPDKESLSPVLMDADPAEILRDLFVSPRAAVRKWAERTNQTEQAKTSYLGQHLASVLTAVPGEGTAARGHDLIEGSEVKSCSRADQLGKCRDCEAPVPAWRRQCAACTSARIDRKTDSHWIFSVRSESELDQLLQGPRIVFILSDRTHDQSDIRVRAWEVWPQEPLHTYFGQFLRDYYQNNYRVKGTRAAPANLHPLKFDFLMMNPIRIFDARLINVDSTSAQVKIDEQFAPDRDRTDAPFEPMRCSLCTQGELEQLLTHSADDLVPALKEGKNLADLEAALQRPSGADRRKAVDAVLSNIPPELRLQIPMRDKKIKTTPSEYARRTLHT